MVKGESKREPIVAVFLFMIIATISFAVVYLLMRITVFCFADYAWYERSLAFLLLASEIFIFLHGLGYLLEIAPVLGKYRDIAEKHPEPEKLKVYPLVLVAVPSYHEPLQVLEETLEACYNLSYPNKEVWLLDDTRYELLPAEEGQSYRKQLDKICKNLNINLFRRPWRGAKAGILNDLLDFIDGRAKTDFKTVIAKPPKYFAIFDADQNPFIDFLEHLVVRMEKDPKVAFIQTPQYYTNFDTNKVARAAGLQQIVFFEYICEGKSMKEAMFCCGTNVLFRMDALRDVKGFEEGTVTEDIATSFKFHVRKWKTKYYSRVGAFGMGPADLQGYFRQQYRWALGTLRLFKKIVPQFFLNPGQLKLYAWWEYFLSTTYYLMGFVFFIMLICPALYLLTGIPSYFAHMPIFSYIFLPYFVVTLVTFFWTLKKRGYKVKELIQGQLLLFVSLPVYIKAAIAAFFGSGSKFEITSKTGSKSQPLLQLWPQLALALISFVAIVWGINRLIFEREPAVAFAVNIFWCSYNFFIMSSVIYFNELEKGAR